MGRYAMTGDFAPSILFSVEPSCETVEQRRQIVELVGLIVGDARPSITGSQCNAVVLKPLSGSRSGSWVFKATSLLASDREPFSAPVVIKVSSLDDISREKAHYDRFVRPFLPAECRPDLLGLAAANGRAALCYSYIGDRERAQTLTNRLAAADMAALDTVLSTLLDRLHLSWYGPSQIETEADLARYYMDRYFDGPTAATKAEDELLYCATRYFGASRQGGGCTIGATAFPSICEVLFSSPAARGYRSCIVHGDLNSDNVILDEDGASARLIDFPRTGRGHVYQDLVSLEASLRINFPSAVLCEDILEAERLIAHDQPAIPAEPYLAAIGKIREVARRFFGAEEEPAGYHFAVAAVGLRLMRATDLSHAARARISAGALWAAKMLAEV